MPASVHNPKSRLSRDHVPWEQSVFLNIPSIAELWGCSRATVFNVAHRGELPLFRVNGRTVAKTADVIALSGKLAQPWSPAPRGAAARAKRSASAHENMRA